MQSSSSIDSNGDARVPPMGALKVGAPIWGPYIGAPIYSGPCRGQHSKLTLRSLKCGSEHNTIFTLLVLKSGPFSDQSDLEEGLLVPCFRRTALGLGPRAPVAHAFRSTFCVKAVELSQRSAQRIASHLCTARLMIGRAHKGLED